MKHALKISPRRIAYRTKGQPQGPVTRLVSPHDLGQKLKPFVFLDLFKVDPSVPTRFGMHPHSGIATLTTLVSGEIHYLKRDGTPGSLTDGGIEWMMAGGGVWHGSALTSAVPAEGFQLWLALPPSLENASPAEVFLTREDIPTVGPARVLLGEYQGVHHQVAAPSPIIYLHVTLKAGERWNFDPPQNHNLAWIAPNEGQVMLDSPVSVGELAVFEDGAGSLAFQAMQNCSFVLGSAAHHPHDLVMGNYSVHTNAYSLAKGEARIAELGVELQRAGRLT